MGRTRDDLLSTFYSLHVATRRRLGTPVQPRRYFELLWERIIAPGHGFVLVAEAEGAPIAAAVFLAANGEIVYKYSASDTAAWSLRPNNALLWHAIKWGCENGYERFDFGRSELDNEGLRSFKRSWGAAELPLVVSTFGETGTRSAGTGPVGALAASLIRRSPEIACRAAGALLYRYAA
jgi:lipid II:glycine glycyltransferase (peptidoglycan interpeptide bridge formation enzyme)